MTDVNSPATYKPSGRCAPRGMAVMLALGFAGTMAACIVIHLLGRVAYIGIVFALLLGLGVGGATLLGVRIGNCRFPLVAGLVGIILGLGGYATLHYLNYRSRVSSFRKSVESKLQAESPDAQQASEALVREHMVREWGSTGFAAYLKGWRKGIRRLFWVVEIALVAFLAAIVPYMAAQDPFCEACERWCDPKEVVVAPLDAREQILDACKPEKAAQLAAFVKVEEGLSRCVVDLHYCPACRRTGFVSVRTLEERGAAGTKESVILSEAVVTGDQVAALSMKENLDHTKAKDDDRASSIPDKSDSGKEQNPACEISTEESAKQPSATRDALQDSKKDGLNDGEV
ncbi:MAG: hypothetical protein AB1696_11250 [Planctomycetota bacterium]